jgi:arylsulfatase A-like enzyme
LPFNAPKKYWDLYSPEKLRLAENPFEPEGVTPYSLTNFGELRKYYGVPRQGPIPDDLARKLIHGYCACVSYIDAQVGRLLDELEQQGLKDNTIVILWGDHGWKLGEHASWSKHTNFETDTRAPLIVSVPGMDNANKRTRALVEFVDIYPSLCDLCDLPKPDHLEGLSFVPLFSDPDREWKQAAFSQYPRRDTMGYTMRTRSFRYTEWRDVQTGEVKARELYDHRSDSLENVNAANKPEYAETVAQLAEMLNRGWRSVLPNRPV